MSKTKKGEVEPGTPNSPEAPATIGTGAPPDPGMSPDPNADMAKATARDIYDRKEEVGEKTGEAPDAPVALSNKKRFVASGPVEKGMKRMLVKSPVSAGGRTYDVDDVVDLSAEDIASLGENVEPFKG